MRKIISLYKRNYDGDRLVYDEVVPGAEWVINGEGIATYKYNGTCCLVRDDKLYKRYDAKHGKTPPAYFVPAQDPDPITGHWPGWLPVSDSNEDRWHREAWDNWNYGNDFYELREPWRYHNGTYELCGPKIQGNPHCLKLHLLLPHGNEVLADVPRDFAGIKKYLYEKSLIAYIEGIVWHHDDGRMVKIKYKDFFK